MNCQICANEIDDEQVLLPCLHAFCQKCFKADACTLCQKPHEGRITPVFKLFPIPDLLTVLHSLGFDYVVLSKSEQEKEKPEKCVFCRLHYGRAFDCLQLATEKVLVQSLCSVCSSLTFDSVTKELNGNSDLFFKSLENQAIEVNIAKNYTLINNYFGTSASQSVEMTRKMFKNIGRQNFVSEDGLKRLLNVINDCQPTMFNSADWCAILRIVSPHCIRWHLIPYLEFTPKTFVQKAFGHPYDGSHRTLNVTLIAYFLYCVRNRVMHSFDWISPTYPDNSYYVCAAILEKIKN